MALRYQALAVSPIFSLILLGICTSNAAVNGEPEKASRKKGAAKVKAIEIVPGKSIGAVALGGAIESLPKGATVAELDGTYMGITFTHKGGKIDDVWIDDLRKMRHPILWAGHAVPPHAKLATLKKLFGPCQTVPGLKGGMSFKCESGIALGCDFNGTGSFVQIRLLPDWGG
jgi:hypothetical protein